MTYIPLEDKASDCFTRFPVSGHRLGLFYIMMSIPICGEQTGNDLKLQPLNPTQHWSFGDLGEAQLQSGGPRRSTCVYLPRDLISRRLSQLAWGSAP